MGNDVSTTINTTARTLIPLDDSICWQLYNSINERSEPISIFKSKQTYSVECRRSIQFLKTIRHPNIIKFLNDFKTYVDHDSFISDCVHPLTNKLLNNHINDSTIKISLGLYQLFQGLQFLHEKASISHNNICLLSVYISINDIWKLGNFECASRYDNLNKKYLSSLKLIRSEDCITPEEDENNTDELDRKDIYAIDVYGFGMLIRNLMKIVNIDDSLKDLLNDLQINLTDDDPQSRPTWSKLLNTQLFQMDYIKATELLDRLPSIDESDLPNVVDSLSTYLDNLNTEYFNEFLIRRLFVPYIFLCASTRIKLLPRILIPKDHNNSWISIENYRLFVIPILIDLFSYHVTCIRETLLEYFDSYWQLIDKTILINIILPQLIYGLKDENNRICMLTLNALASMVPILGADIVVGGQRKQIFTDKLKKETVGLSKINETVSTTNTSVSTLPAPSSPQKTRKSSPVTINKTKPLRLKPITPDKTTSVANEPPPPPPPPPPPLSISPEYTNGYHSSSDNSPKEIQTTIVENARSDHHNEEEEIDKDDGQWSDWDHNSDPFEPSPTYSQTFPPLSPPPVEQSVIPKSTISPLKSLKLTNISKPKWDPNAPLGSEYEIPSVSLTRKPSIKTETIKTDDTDDFFKDMAPKVQTVELMEQLETMFNINTNHSKEQVKSTTTTFSSKFGITSQIQDDNQEIESGNNNWDE